MPKNSAVLNTDHFASSEEPWNADNGIWYGANLII